MYQTATPSRPAGRISASLLFHAVGRSGTTSVCGNPPWASAAAAP